MNIKLIKSQSPKIPLTELYAVNWAALKDDNNIYLDSIDITPPSTFGYLEDECDMVMLGQIKNTTPIYNDITSITNRSNYEFRFDTSLDNNSNLEFIIGSTYLLNNTPLAIQTVNLNYDIFAIGKSASTGANPFINPDSFHRFNINSYNDINVFAGSTGSSSFVINKKLIDPRNYNNSFPDGWSSDNEYGLESNEDSIVKFYMGIARIPAAVKPKVLHEKIPEFPHARNGTINLAVNGATESSYNWIRIFDGSNISEIIKRSCDILDVRPSTYVITFKVAISEKLMADCIHRMANHVISKQPSAKILKMNNGGTSSQDDIFGLRIYCPSFSVSSTDAVTSFEVPVAGDSKFNFDKFIWKTPRTYRRNANLSYAIGFEFFYEDNEYQYIESAMDGEEHLNLEDMKPSTSRTIELSDKFDNNSIFYGVARKIKNAPIDRGTFAKSIDGKEWSEISGAIPLFSDVTYNNNSGIFIRKSNVNELNDIKHNESFGLVKESIEMVDPSLHKYSAYVPSDKLRKILLDSKNIRVTIWTFDGSRNSHGTLRGIQNGPTKTWLK